MKWLRARSLTRPQPSARHSAIRILFVLLLAAAVFGVAFLLYLGSSVQRYDLEVGDISPQDIAAPRSIPDEATTRTRADQAAAAVPDILVHDSQAAERNVVRTNRFFTVVSAFRTEIAASVPPPDMETAALGLLARLRLDSGLFLTQEDALRLVSVEEAIFTGLSSHGQSVAGLLRSQSIAPGAVSGPIRNQTERLEETAPYLASDLPLLNRILDMTHTGNMAVDEDATAAARTLARNRVLENPVMIEKGTRIVSYGDVITADTLALLESLGLVEDGRLDVRLLGGLLMLSGLCTILLVLYLRRYAGQDLGGLRPRAAVVLSLLLPLLIGIYSLRLSPLASPVVLCTVLAATFFGFRTGLVLSSILSLLMLPLAGYDARFMAVSLIAAMTASIFIQGVSRRDNHAYLILAAALASALAALASGLLLSLEWGDLLADMGFAASASGIAAILAIGLMSLFEAAFNGVSPIRLIELSHPGSPLMRRLFLEAPGTSQHSMMVANLAETAAAAVGANPLIARAGACYHDIGKLEEPGMYTENQDGDNPHDRMEPERSAAVILSHPEKGLRIARRHRIPEPVCRVIAEHHGTSPLAYFLHKAGHIAQESGLPEPDPETYRYPGPVPSSRESALVMLADACEAAVRSTRPVTLDDTEALLRRIVHQKIEQDQLARSGLAFSDIEAVIRAFLQTYAGHFHERVKYPDDTAGRKPAVPA